MDMSEFIFIFEDFINIPLENVLTSLGILLFLVLIRRFVIKRIFNLLTRLTTKTKTNFDDEIIKGFERPINFLFIFFAIYVSVKYLNIEITKKIFVQRLFRTSIIVALSWGVYNLEGINSIVFRNFGRKFKGNLNNTVISLLSKTLRGAIIGLAIVMIAEEWGYNVSGFVAGLGLGGLAIAMAAKDTLANMFGGITAIADKQYDLGDWIKINDIEGVVEDVNFRSTKVRRFDKSLVSVPNSVITTNPVINFSRRGIRRIDFKLGVTYSTSMEDLKKVLDEIKQMLIKHPNVDNETLFVEFDGFGASSLDIFLYFFTNTANWADYLNIKSDVNFKIMEILELHGVEVAFPSTSIYFENELKNKDQN